MFWWDEVYDVFGCKFKRVKIMCSVSLREWHVSGDFKFSRDKVKRCSETHKMLLTAFSVLCYYNILLCCDKSVHLPEEQQYSYIISFVFWICHTVLFSVRRPKEDPTILRPLICWPCLDFFKILTGQDFLPRCYWCIGLMWMNVLWVGRWEKT